MRISLTIIFLFVISISTESHAADQLPTDKLETAAVSDSVLAVENSRSITDFLKQNGDTGLLGALKKAQSQYGVAVRRLADKTVHCQSKNIDESWRARAEKKFGKDRFKKLDKDFKLAVGAKYYSNFMGCEKEEVAEALYSEANLLPLLFEFGESLTEFLKKSTAENAEQAKAAKAYIDSLQGAKPTPLQMVVNPALQLKTIAKAALLDSEIRGFVDSEPAFKGSFNLSAAIKSNEH